MKFTRKRFWIAVAMSLFFCVMGFGMRHAENNQVGYTHDTSMWIFGIAGLCAYYATIALYVLHRRRK